MATRADLVEIHLPKPRLKLPRFIAIPPTSEAPLAGSEVVRDSSLVPYQSVGLLVDGHTGTATTAFLVDAQHILTAAHAVHRPQQRQRVGGLHFALQYTRSQGGYWSRVTAAATLRGWDLYRDYHYDLALCRLDQVCSAKPLRLGTPPPDTDCETLVVGYSHGGGQLCQARCHDLRWNRRGARISAPMREGCSGGPWLIKIGRSFRVIGLTSQGGEGFVLSPAWGSGLSALLDWAKLGSV